MQEVSKVKHFVVLMLENRSFDHMLGFMKVQEPEIDGLLGIEYNLPNPKDPTGSKVLVTPNAPYVPDLNPSPGHEVRDVLIQMYGGSPSPTGQRPTMEGFVYDYGQIPGVTEDAAKRIMDCFSPRMLPVLSTLASEFAVCDHWFSSLPGPTWPNRLYVHAATSDGRTDNNPHQYAMKSIFENLYDLGKEWRIYFHDLPQSAMLTNLRNARYLRFFESYEDAFDRDCRSGDLPTYSFIEPRYSTLGSLRGNDQHPDHGVELGEVLIADVYQALRASPNWEESALLILWDEHGGFYDHVPPGSTVNPDGKNSPEFDFGLLGVRVPAVLVSPWVQRGFVDHTVYDHSSVPATLKNMFGLRDFLTKRDTAANCFDHLFALAQPRTDAPRTLDLRPRPPGGAVGEKASGPPTDFQRSLVALANDLAPENAKAQAQIRTEHDAAVHLHSTGKAYFLA
jgi:phospholipase C